MKSALLLILINGYCFFVFLFLSQLKEFYARQQERRERLGRIDEERLALLRSSMEEQARRDQER